MSKSQDTKDESTQGLNLSGIIKSNDIEPEMLRAWLLLGRDLNMFKVEDNFDQAQKKGLYNNFVLILLYQILIVLVVSIFIFTCEYNLYVTAMGGAAGSALAALISILNRYANGYEDDKGNQYPKPNEKKERFSKRMTWWFIVRPLVGAIAGVLIYCLIIGKTTWIDPLNFTNYSYAGYSFIAGYFAKTLFDSFAEWVKKFLTK